MGFRYLKKSDALIELAQVQAGSEDSNYPAANVAILPVSKPWRSAEGGISAVKLRFDYGFPQSIDTVALVNHNLTSGGTITLNGGTAPDPDGTEFTTSISWAKGTAWKFLSATATYQYWTLLLTDEANTHGYLQIGYLSIGLKTEPSVNFNMSWKVSRAKVVRLAQNEVGVPMVGNLLSSRALVELAWVALNNAERAEVDGFLDSLGGATGPLLIVPDETETEAYFCRLADAHTLSRFYPVTDIRGVIFAEDPHGIAVTETPFHYEP